MIDAAIRLGNRSEDRVAPGIFGGFVEHFGTGLYGGLWDAAADHPRADVMAAVRGMGVTALRYPGGCFADWYHWRDGVGEIAARPHHERTFWTDLQLDGVELSAEMTRKFGPPEPNRVGTDEFLRYCNDVGAEPLLTANFGTGTPQEAADWVAYVNRREGSPRSVRWWFVGNETYGVWELGHCSGTEYGRRFVEFSDAMRSVDPEIRLIAVGAGMARDTQWNKDMLAAAGPALDMVSLHSYFPGAGLGRDLADTENEVHQLLVGARSLGDMLDRSMQLIDDAGHPDIPVSLDEWNLWSEWPDLLNRTHRLCDSLYFGGVFNRMIERAHRVRFAMISHLVNCMAPIQTTDGGMHVTAAYLTFLLYREHARRFRVPVEVDAPVVAVQAFPELVGTGALGGTAGTAAEVSILDVAATADERGTTVFVCTGALDEPVRATIAGLAPSGDGVARWLRGPGPFARNSFDAPDRLGFARASCSTDGRGRCTFELPPATVSALSFPP